MGEHFISQQATPDSEFRFSGETRDFRIRLSRETADLGSRLCVPVLSP